LAEEVNVDISVYFLADLVNTRMTSSTVRTKKF